MGEKRWGDRKDGKLLRDLDSMHFIMPLIYPNRCDNEAFVSERIDLTSLDAYIKERFSDSDESKYGLFQIIISAILKTIILRPKLNRFVANGNTYQRNDVSASFVMKKNLSDDGDEGLALIQATGDDTLATISHKIDEKISSYRSEGQKDSTGDIMNLLIRLPRFISKSIIKLVCILDKHGMVPAPLIESDPYYSSVILTNLGSIRLRSGYHHLTNWGTTSIFVIIGKRKKRAFYDKNGNVTMKQSIYLGLTVDERIADGFYFSKSIRLLKKLLEHPELLEGPFSEDVNLTYQMETK